jgi:tetratricopeptide (TPR) repeat protein
MYRGDGEARLRDSESAWKILAKRTDVNERERFFVVASIAAGHHQAGHYAQALPYYDQAIVLGRSAFGAAHVYPATNLLNRSGALSHLGRFDEAETGLRASLADYRRIFDKPRDYMLANWRELELLYYRQGRFELALQARDAWDRLLREAEPGNRLEQAKSQVWRARDLVRLGRADEAAALLHAAMPILETSERQERNRLMAHSASMRLACDRPIPTVPARTLEQASLHARAMTGDSRVFAAEARALAGLCALRSGHPSQALVHLDQAAALAAALPAGDIAEVAEHQLWRGEALAANGEPAAARRAWDEALRSMLAADLEGHPLTATLRRAGR